MTGNRSTKLTNKIISAVSGSLIGGGFSFALFAALSLKYGWTWGVEAPYAVINSLHVNGVIIGLTTLAIGLSAVSAIMVLRKWHIASRNFK